MRQKRGYFHVMGDVARGAAENKLAKAGVAVSPHYQHVCLKNGRFRRNCLARGASQGFYPVRRCIEFVPLCSLAEPHCTGHRGIARACVIDDNQRQANRRMPPVRPVGASLPVQHLPDLDEVGAHPEHIEAHRR